MEKAKATVKDAPLKRGCRVLLRADYNVPVNEAGQITDDKRIVDSLPTLEYCLKRQVKLIICSHFGRPDGQYDAKYSLRPVYERLQQLLPQTEVRFATDCVGDAVQQQVAALPNGAILLLENTRFHPEETANDPAFARELASCADIFVNDAFGAVHRAHASTVGVCAYLPSYAGLLLTREMAYFDRLLKKPRRPFTVIIGGKKASDKLPLVQRLLNLADYILVGGRLAQEWVAPAEPHRAVIKVSPDQGADISPTTMADWEPIIRQSKTIFWNGPLGQFEVPANAMGTYAVASIVASTKATSVVGGGDTAAAVRDFQFSHLSTGGGAALEYLQGKNLPGITALNNKGGK